MGTKEFAQAIINRLGKRPNKLKAVSYIAPKPSKKITPAPKKQLALKTLVGVDIFIDDSRRSPKELAKLFSHKQGDNLKLQSISCKGINVWPVESAQALLSDHWRLRFAHERGLTIDQRDIIQLLTHIQTHNLDCIKTENLYLFNKKPGFSGPLKL